MGRKRGRKDADQTWFKKSKVNPQNNPEPSCRLLALHAELPMAALVVGSQIRLLDWSSSKIHPLVLDNVDVPSSDTNVRTAAFQPDGNLLLTAGDDKHLRLWDTTTCTVARSIKASKKISAGAFTNDGKITMFADKFGDVSCSSAEGEGQPFTILGHFCSIVTSLAQSPDNRYLVTTDREFKVRVSKFPDNPLQQASYEIQSYCLGHTAFITCAVFVGDAASSLLLTASGDGTVRLWDHVTGKLLDTFQAATPAAVAAAGLGDVTEASDRQHQQPAAPEDATAADEQMQDAGDEQGEVPPEDEEGEQEGANVGGGEFEEAVGRKTAPGMAGMASVLWLAASRDRCTVCATLEGEHAVLLLRVDAAAGKLQLQQRLQLDRVAFPCRSAFDSQGRLWVLGGVPATSTISAHIGVAHLSGSGEWVECTNEVLTADIRQQLECRDEAEEARLAEAPTLSYSEHLRKVHLTKEERDSRKTNRNDRKEAARLSALLEPATA